MFDVVKFNVTGISPILMGNPESMIAKSASGTGKAKTSAQSIPGRDEEAALSAYVNPDGQLYMPTVAFRVAILAGSKGRKVGKRSARDFFKGSLFCETQKTLLVDAKGKPITKWVVDTRRVVIPSNKAAVARSRAMVDKWCCVLELQVDRDFIPVGKEEELVLDILNIAGKTIGIGNFRPERGGEFGRFSAELVK